MGRSNTVAAKGSAQAPTLVQVQTMRTPAGPDTAFAEVQKALKSYNATHKGAEHIVKRVTAVQANAKGMQWQLALLATVARVHGATMVRLSVHNADVALCGPKAAIDAVQSSYATYVNTYHTTVANTYNPATHGNRVGFVNAFMCGMPAGLQLAASVAPTLAYGIGYLFAFQSPTNVGAYLLGQAAGSKLGKIAASGTTRTTRTTRKPKATDAPATDAPATDAPATDAPSASVAA